MSDLLDSIPELKSISAGRPRLLAEIMVLAFLSIYEEGQKFLLDPEAFLYVLTDHGFCVEIGDHHLLVSKP
jgi:hypothetical protein